MPHSSTSTHGSSCLALAQRGAAAGSRAPSKSGQSPGSCPFPGLSCSSSANLLLSSSQFEKNPTRWYCIISMEAFQHTEDLEIKSENFSSSLSSISFPEITAINSKVTFLPDFCLYLHLHISSIPPPKMDYTVHIVQQLAFSPHTQLSVSTHVCVLHAKSLQSCPILCDPMDYSLPGFSVHGIPQERILEWVAMPSSRGSSPTQGWNSPKSTCIGRWVLYH